MPLGSPPVNARGVRVLSPVLLAAGFGLLGFVDSLAGQADPIAMRVVHPPQPVVVAGETCFTLELRLESNEDVLRVRKQTMRELEVLVSGKRLAAWDGEALAARLASLSRGEAAKRRPVHAPALIYLDFALPKGANVPAELDFCLTFDDGIISATTKVDRSPAVTFGPPLRGGPWVAIYGAAMERGHRRVWFDFSAPVHIPARFAIDFVKLDEKGAFAKGDDTKVASHFGYGAEVLAVGDATVVSARSHLPEDDAVSTARRPLYEASGNYVSLDLGNGRYVHYEHLRPESLKVRVGDKVQRGQVLAELGNTGDSTGPHLHLHVSNAATPLAGEGLPFALESWEWLGQYESLDKFGQQPWSARPAGQAAARRGERPRENAVVRFR